VSYSFLTYDDIVQSGCGPQDIDDQVAIPRALAGVQVALLFSEGEPGVIRVTRAARARRLCLDRPVIRRRRTTVGGHSYENRSMQEAIDMVVAATGAHLDDRRYARIAGARG
jgi:hypothetical protein